MTFSITVPNASQSPGIFPAQNNTNFSRLKSIINNDHNFTNSSSSAQGIHKQVTMIDRSAPVALSAGNGILFSSQIDGASQLSWFNGSDTYQLTPLANAGPLAIVGSILLNGNTTSNLLVDTTGKQYYAKIFTQYRANNSASDYLVYQYNNGSSVDSNAVSTYGSGDRPTPVVTTTSIKVRNNGNSSRTVLYYIWISYQ